MFIITVTGDIIANDKNHYAQNWVCHTTSSLIEDTLYDYNRNQHSVQSNLILNKDIRAVPYAVYFSEKGIRTESSGEIFAAPGASAAHLCYKDNIIEIENILKIPIASEIEIYLYNGLFTGIFSVLELFLSDVLLCLIFKNSVVYERALDYLKEEEKKKKIKLIDSDKDLSIQKYFSEGIVYHRFDKVRSVFKRVLLIPLPNTKKIKSCLHKRHNITHRFAFSNIDRMRITVIDSDILKDFILCCNEFVDKIMEEINKKY